MQLQTTQIRTDGGTQPRLQLDGAVISEYAESMANGSAFPPVVVFYDGVGYWLADGYHRLHAACSLGLAEIAADVRQGTLQDAQWYSYSVNQTHGLRRSNDDKRRAVEAALKHEYAANKTDVQIASHIGVSSMTIGRYRSSLENNGDINKVNVRQDSNGRMMDVSGIGKPAPDPQTDDDYEPLTPYELDIARQHIEAQSAPVSNAPINFAPADSVEWYTPSRYIEAARRVMGAFDTDPASNDTAQAIIQAETYYTIDDNGFDKPWHGRVWLNPPYGVENGKAVAGKWAERLIDQHRMGITSEAILLVNAVIDSKWFNMLWSYPICFTDHRIRFELPQGASKDANTSPVIGSAIVYLGSNVAAFVREFSQFGAVVARLHEYDDQIFTEMEIANANIV